MAETVTIGRPSVAKPVSRPRPRKPTTVSASALALHLDCTRTTISPIIADGGAQGRLVGNFSKMPRPTDEIR